MLDLAIGYGAMIFVPLAGGFVGWNLRRGNLAWAGAWTGITLLDLVVFASRLSWT